MTVDEKLRDSLHRRADLVKPSDDGWTAIGRHIERHQRRTRSTTLSLVAGLSLAAVAVAALMITMAVPQVDDQDVAATGPPRTPGATATLPFSSVTTTIGSIGPVAGSPSGGAPPVGVAAQPNPATTVVPDGGPLQGGSLAATGAASAGAVYPETADEPGGAQSQVAAGRQPSGLDPTMVVSSYLDNRGLTVDDGGGPRFVGDSGALRYTAGGVGGWVSVGRSADGTTHFVAGSRTDRVARLHAERRGDRLAVDVLPTAAGKVIVRTKRPGSTWNPAATQPAVAGQTASLTVDGPAADDLIVQVRHEGDDGRVGISDQLLGLHQDHLDYEGLHDGSVLTANRLGPVDIGHSLAWAEQAAGIAMTTDVGESCTSLSPVGRPEGVAFVSTRTDGKVDVIIVAAPGVRTEAGIGVGSTVAEVRQAHPNLDEQLTGGDGRILYRPGDPVQEGYGMVFGILDGRVAVIWSGPAGLAETDEICA